MRWGRSLVYALLGLWSLICIGPLYWLAVTSLKGPAALVYGPVYVPGLDFTPEFGAWRDILDTGEIGAAAFLTGSEAQTLPPFIVGQMSIREQQAGSDPDEIGRMAVVTMLMVIPLVLVTGWAQRAIVSRTSRRPDAA